MPHPYIAAVIFSSLGVNVLGALLLPLFNPRDRGIRWWAIFILTLAVWLLVEGLAAATGERARWSTEVAVIVHALPAVFLSFALVRGRNASPRVLVYVLLGALATLPFTLAGRYSPVALAWQCVCWLSAIVVLWRTRGSYFAEGLRSRFGRTALVLFMGVPLGVVAGLLLVGDRYFLYVMPLLLMLMQGLMFVAVVRVRLGDIEVRVARTSDLATDATQRERLAIIGEVAAALAHEVRNPLAGMRSLAQRVAEEEVDGSRRRRYAGVIIEEIERVDGIITNLLGFAKRGEAAHPAPALSPVPALLEDLALLTASRAERAGVRLHLDARSVEQLAPREPLAQVLLNLLLNAIQHSPRGGSIDVLATQSESGVEFVVRDEGPGIALELRDRIFRPFYSGRGGTGLGLAVVHRVISENEWSIAVREAPTGGAEFWLRIPASQPRTA